MSIRNPIRNGVLLALGLSFTTPVYAQLTDVVQAPNPINAGIHKSLAQQIGVGRGDILTPGSSAYLLGRDPFRAVRRGRQLFQRKFSFAEGLGPRAGDGVGPIDVNAAIGAGLSDSCASCHGRPRGAAGFGGDVVTRPDSRDAPHLFGLGLVEMLADEMTADLRTIQATAIDVAQAMGTPITMPLISKGVRFGFITANPDGGVDTLQVEGVNADLRIRPFFADGRVFSMREFIVGALRDEMGLQAVDPDLLAASLGEDVVTPAGLLLTGSLDTVGAPPVPDAETDGDGDGVVNEFPTSLVDYSEFYLLNYFKAARYEVTAEASAGQKFFDQIGCTECHVADLTINRDRRIADLNTVFDKTNGIFNGLFATATPLFTTIDDGSGNPLLKEPVGQPFVVKNIYSDLKRHDLGPAFHERNYDGSTTTQFVTEPLWGVGSSPPYGHDGRSINLREVIIRHGGEAADARDNFLDLPRKRQDLIIKFLDSLVLFPPDDTASTLDPGDPSAPGFPQAGHGSIKLSVLFNDPADAE